MTFLTLLTALALSGVSAYYSVIGLAAIFPGSFWPIIIMGSVLEMAKLVTVSWLYRNWKTCPLLMKSYYITACVILMLITSMGIFGYLSKAHLEHSADTAPLSDKVTMLDEKIKTEKDNIDVNRKSLKQLDESVDQIMSRSSDEKGADKAVSIRKAQTKDRNRISQEIAESQKTISALNEERTPLNVALQKAESGSELEPNHVVGAPLSQSSLDCDARHQWCSTTSARGEREYTRWSTRRSIQRRETSERARRPVRRSTAAQDHYRTI